MDISGALARNIGDVVENFDPSWGGEQVSHKVYFNTLRVIWLVHITKQKKQQKKTQTSKQTN